LAIGCQAQPRGLMLRGHCRCGRAIPRVDRRRRLQTRSPVGRRGL